MTDQGPGIRPALPIAPGATNPTPTAPLPSRAAMPQAAPPAAVESRANLPMPTTAQVEKKRARDRARRAAAKKPQLSAAEIKRLNAKREKSLKKPKRPSLRKQARAVASITLRSDTPKNPNRPLELRNQMDAMLSVVDALRRPELVAFKVMMQHLAPLPKKARRKIIAALAQVYP